MLKYYRFDLDIPADRYLQVYSGAARDVIAVSEGGVRVRFPARYLTRFVTREGVHGRYELCVNESVGNGRHAVTKNTETKLISLNRIV